MKFLLDQSTDARLVTHLKHLGHDVTRIGSDFPAGLPDEKVLSLARKKQAFSLPMTGISASWFSG